MRSMRGPAIVLCVTFCISRGTMAQDVLHFWTAAGDHGVAACVFNATMPTATGNHGGQRLDFGVSADPDKPELIGKVKLRQADLPSSPRLLEIGAGTQTLLSVTVQPTDAQTMIADVPGNAMAAVLRSLVPHALVWMRIGDGAEQQAQSAMLSVDADAQHVPSCLSALEGDLARQRQVDTTSGIQATYFRVPVEW